MHFLSHIIADNFMQICQQRIIQQVYPYHANSYSINIIEYLLQIYSAIGIIMKSIFEHINK